MSASGDYFSVKATGTILGKPWNNQWWYFIRNNADSTTPALLCDYLIDNFYTDIFTQLVDDCVLTTVEAANWTNAVEYAIDSPPALVGSIATDAMPSWLSFSIKYARRGTGYNYPRKSIPGVPESAQSGGVINNTVKAYIQAVADVVTEFSLSNGAIMQQFAVNPYPVFGTSAAAIVTSPYHFQEVHSCVDVILGTQKSRK